MSTKVLLTAQAESELRQAADWIARKSPETADRWFNGFVKAIISLEKFPDRCGPARESANFPFELRQLLYGRRRSYRALFVVRDTNVVVVSIRHTAQRDLSPEDLGGSHSGK